MGEVHWWEVMLQRYEGEPSDVAFELYKIGSHGVYLEEKKGLCFHPDFVKEDRPPLFAYFPFSAGETVAILEERFSGALIEARPVNEREIHDPANGRVIEVGPFKVLPPWMRPEPGKGAFTILSGIAFGSGSHPTTRLALEWIGGSARILKGRRMLDCGSGTGILSIAGALCGARVVSVDIQMKSALVTLHNVRANGVSSQIKVICADVRDIKGKFDVIVANLITPVLSELIPHIFSLLSPEGVLFITGVMKGEEKALEKVLPGEVKDVRELEGWMGYELRRSGGTA